MIAKNYLTSFFIVVARSRKACEALFERVSVKVSSELNSRSKTFGAAVVVGATAAVVVVGARVVVVGAAVVVNGAAVVVVGAAVVGLARTEKQINTFI